MEQCHKEKEATQKEKTNTEDEEEALLRKEGT